MVASWCIKLRGLYTMEFFFKYILTPILTLSALGIGVAVSFGKMKESLVTKNNCKKSMVDCNNNLSKKIDSLTSMVMKGNKEQDLKREQDKEHLSRELIKLNKSIGTIEGHIDVMRNGKR